MKLNRVDTTWTLDPRVNTGIEADVRQGAERGTGNVVSAEFNLCYRWHSCISEKDEKWIEEFYWDLFGKPSAEVGVQDLLAGFAKFESRLPEDPLQRPFNKFKRGPDGKFSDDDLVECIVSAIEDCAGSFGARNVPASMRAIEILGIIQGRKWNVASLNEFRRHFGLKPYETFEDINSDPGVADALRRLYDHPDFVELYPGIVAEERKEPMVPGVGIAPTYTISRVVLSDAVVLVRSDRHYTIDYSPRHLTNWGYNDVQYDLNVNHGCVFYKLSSMLSPTISTTTLSMPTILWWFHLRQRRSSRTSSATICSTSAVPVVSGRRRKSRSPRVFAMFWPDRRSTGVHGSRLFVPLPTRARPSCLATRRHMINYVSRLARVCSMTISL